MSALRASLLFGLIWALTSFGFTAGALVTVFGQPSYISPGQLYGVASICVVSALASLGLVTLLALNFLGRRAIAERFPAQALVVIGLTFCVVAMYSFLAVVSTNQQEDFFGHFARGARFEFLLIGVAALIMGTRPKGKVLQ